jgi:hypothetical protein
MTDTTPQAGQLIRRGATSSRLRIDSLGVLAFLFLLSFPLTGQQTPGQPAQEPSAAELAKQTQNPISSLISVPFQSNSDFGLGDQSATGSLMNFQPVVPFAINSSTNIILRVIIPLSSQPAPDGTRINGLGDTVVSAFFSPSKSGKVIWGAGPVLLLPTASQKQLGTEKFGIGPTAVALVQPGKWTLGALANQIWSTSGAVDRAPVNMLFLQPFASYNLGKGLALGVGMEASTNWKAAEKVTAPLLFSVSKVTMLGRRPVNLAAAAGPYVFSPRGGPSWRFRFSATFLYPR